MASFRKTSVHDFHQQIKDIRAQLFDQVKCLEQRTDVQITILGEVNDFLRKKAELDLEYSKQLDKLVKSVMIKHKNEKQRRSNWTLYSSCQLWQQLVDDTKEEARQRSITADVYANHVVPAITQRSAALQKISKKCREVGVLAQGEVVRVLHELQTAMKTYQLCFAQFNAISAQLQQAETQRNKCNTNSSIRKQRSAQKTFDKKSEKFEGARLKCTRARNEYLLCIDAANASLHKYFADDISDLVDCCDLGMDWWLSLVLQNMIAARKSACQVEMNALANLGAFKDSLQSLADKQRFFENNHQAFMLPKRFDFKCEESEKTVHISVAEGTLAEEFRQRHHQIRKRLGTLRAESELSWQNMEEAERQIRDLLSACTLVQVTEFGIAAPSTTNSDSNERRPSSVSDGFEPELTKAYEAYIKTFSYYLFNANLIMRLEARADGIGNALSAVADQSPSHLQLQDPGIGNCSLSSANSRQIDSGKNGQPSGSIGGGSSTGGDNKTAIGELQHRQEPPDTLEWAQRRRKKRIGSQASTELVQPPVAAANPQWRRPRLFGGSLEEYTELTGEPIPLVVVSCIRVLSQHALHHQGLFRISGSQLEINHMREAYEIGEDPLYNVQDASDANSIAGVLKLYLRELREPLFPFYLFDLLTDCAKCSSTTDFIGKICPLLNKLPRPTYLLLRYLFAFLNHLSEFSDENMMDPYNLAICFGPTLLPIPEGKDQVYYQNSVNEVVKNLIVHADAIFTSRVPGPRYEKYSALEGTPAGDLSNELDLYVDDELSTAAVADHQQQPDNWSSLQQLKRLSAADLPFPPPSPQFHRFHQNIQQSSPQHQHRLPFLANANPNNFPQPADHSNNNGEKSAHFAFGSPSPSNNNVGPNKLNPSATTNLMNWSLCSANSSLMGAGGVEHRDHQQRPHGFPTGNGNNTYCYSSSESGIGADPGTKMNNNGLRNTVAATAADVGLQSGSRSPQRSGIGGRHGGHAMDSSTAELYASIHKGDQQRIRQAIAPATVPTAFTGRPPAPAGVNGGVQQQKSPSPATAAKLAGAGGVNSLPPYSVLYGKTVADTGRSPPSSAGISTSSSVIAERKTMRSPPTGPSPTRRRNSVTSAEGAQLPPTISSTSVSIQPQFHHQQQQQHRSASVAAKKKIESPRDASSADQQQKLRQQRREQINAIDELLGKLSTAAVAGAEPKDQNQQ